jgi:hypothetical protein
MGYNADTSPTIILLFISDRISRAINIITTQVKAPIIDRKILTCKKLNPSVNNTAKTIGNSGGLMKVIHDPLFIRPWAIEI